MKEFFTNIGNWIKKHPIISIAVVLGIAYLIYKWISGVIQKAKDKKHYDTAVSESQTSLNQLANQGIHPSYGLDQYNIWADSLEKLFDGCTIAGASASGWDIISNIFDKMKNEADVYALIKAYGVRTTDRCGIGNGDNEADLGTTLTDHFSGSEAFLIRHDLAEINGILKKHSIVFQF